MRKLSAFFCTGTCRDGTPPVLDASYALRFPALWVCDANGAFQALFLSHRRFSVAQWKQGIELTGVHIESHRFYGRGGRSHIAETLDKLVEAHGRIHGRDVLPPDHFTACGLYLQGREEVTRSPPLRQPLSCPLRRLRSRCAF